MRTLMAVLIAVLLVSCAPERQRGSLDDPGRTVRPRAGNGISLVSEAREERPGENSAGLPELKVRLPADYLPSQAITANLDIGETEEQIIVFKRRDDPDDLMRLLVVTYDTIRSAWIRAWEGVTGATSVRSFSVYTDDLIGDLEQELVAFGINAQGEQTLDIYRRTSSALGLGLTYTRILSIAADVTIRIEEVDRPDTHDAMGLAITRSYPVVAERLDPDADNPFGTIRTTYLWDFAARRYVEGRVDRIAGDAIADSQLREVVSGTAEEFERFLSGPWYRSSTAGEIQLLSFDPREREVVFHSGYLQQAFRWDNSSKPVAARGITVYLTNLSIRTIKRLIHVSAVDLNRITVAIQGSDGLDGTYQRLAGSLQAAVLQAGPRVRLSSVQLSGLFRSDSGVEIVFSNPEFTHRAAGSVRSGGYAVYEVGDATLLELRFIDENRLPLELMRYRATYHEKTDDNRVIRTLGLEPGTVGISGFRSNGGPALLLEQIEVVQTPGG